MDLIDAFSSFTADFSDEPDLKDFFVETQTLRELKNNSEVCVISGIKGSGKTALFRDLSEFKKDADVEFSISSDNHSVRIKDGNLRPKSFAKQFEYEICIQLFRALGKTKHFKNLDDDLKKEISKHVKTQEQKFKGVLDRFGGVSVLGCGFSVHKSEAEKQDLLINDKERNNSIETLKKLGQSGVKLKLVIDDPEDVFFTNSEPNVNVLGGLWLAGAKLNKYSDNIRVFILMKTHIYDLTFHKTPDLDKYPNSHQSICWETQDFERLIKNRLIHFIKETNEDNCLSILWNNIPNSEIATNLDYITTRLRNGPRELITWIHKALSYNKQNEKNYLDLKSIKHVELSLASASFTHFKSSYDEEFKDVGKFITIVFEKTPSKVLNFDELKDSISRLSQNNQDFQSLKKRNSWMQELTINELIELLFRVGCINLKNDSKKTIAPYMCSYTKDNFSNSIGFQLTPLFEKYLNRG